MAGFEKFSGTPHPPNTKKKKSKSPLFPLPHSTPAKLKDKSNTYARTLKKYDRATMTDEHPRTGEQPWLTLSPLEAAFDASAMEQIDPSSCCESWGQASAPLSPSLGKVERRVSLWMSALEQQTKPIAKDAAKDSKEPAVEASFSSAPTPQAEDASEPLFWCSLASKHWGKTRQRLGASKPLLTCFLLSQVKALPATSQPSSFAKLRTRQSLSKQVNNTSKPFQASAKRVRALELARLFDAFLLPQVETIHPRASQVASPSWGRVRASPSCSLSSRTLVQNASKPLSQPSILCSLQTLFPPSQVVTLPSKSQPSCSTNFNTPLAKLHNH